MKLCFSGTKLDFSKMKSSFIFSKQRIDKSSLLIVIFKPKQRLIKQNNKKTDNGPERTIHQNGYATQGHNLQSLLYLCRKRLY